MHIHFQVPQGSFRLGRLPVRKNEPLQAWDAADEYLLNYLASQNMPPLGAQITILNDGFGALALALHAFDPIAISDSFLSQQATRNNLQNNGIDPSSIRLLDSLSVPDSPIDYLLVKIPKTLGLLEYQLHRIRPLIKPDAKIIAASMVKSLPANAWKLLERLIGPTVPSLAVKKARLIFAEYEPQLSIPANPYPIKYKLENTRFTISNHANVFSRDSLDIGTRLLLKHLPDVSDYRHMIDLGCGNGAVGLVLAERWPDARISFVDESFMAVASAKENFDLAHGAGRQANFVVNDGLSGFPADSADCIVCNPPFHQQHTIGDQIAWQMFRQSHEALRRGGELRVIGNRHLNYHHALKKLFGNFEHVAGNAKFVIVKAVKA